VYPAIASIKKGKIVEFEDGKSGEFDVIVFATGYKTNVKQWLKDYKELFNENGMPKSCYPNHWKGGNGIYCAGFSKNGLQGIANDAQKIADDICSVTINARKLPSATEANAQIKSFDE
ncbi:flavin containing monooxygenase YUCCA10-like protein, partial [Trifolium medium]|nr:flavin containing monooxygenase YUCCA10-like protein [Trifolium medium]